MIGTQLENYRVLERIGEGGMGAVYRAFDVMLERDVALKFLHPDLARQPELVERFRSEAVVLARLMHPNIAHVHGLHRHREEYYMAMEYVPGSTLSAFVKRDGPMPLGRALRIVADVLGALDYAHRQGVVHRDIKTSNVIVTPGGTVKVMDFGIARVLGSDRRTRVGTIVGTLGYMSPEQIQGFEVDGRSDIYSLGIVLFELLTGRVPFEAETEWKLMQAQIEQPPPLLRAYVDAPLAVEAAFQRALAKPPAERFQTASEFRQALVGLAEAALASAGEGSPAGADVMATLERQGWPGAGAGMPGDQATLHRAAPSDAAADADAVASTPERPATAVPPPAPAAGASPAESIAAANAPSEVPRVSASARAPAPVVGARTSTPPSPRRSRRIAPVGLAVLVLAGIAGSWIWLNRPGGAVLPAGDTGQAALPAVSGGPAPAQAAPAVPVPPPPPEPPLAVAPPSPPPATGRPAQPPAKPALGGSGTTVASGQSTRRNPGSAASVAPLPSTSTVHSAPVAAPVAPVRFDRVKLVRRTSSDSELEVDAVLALEPGRLVVFNVTGRNALRTLDVAGVTSATYAESSQTRVFVRTRRYALRLGSGADVIELRLDRNNARQIVEAFEKWWGAAVTRSDGNAK